MCSEWTSRAICPYRNARARRGYYDLQLGHGHGAACMPDLDSFPLRSMIRCHIHWEPDFLSEPAAQFQLRYSELMFCLSGRNPKNGNFL